MQTDGAERGVGDSGTTKGKFEGLKGGAAQREDLCRSIGESAAE